MFISPETVVNPCLLFRVPICHECFKTQVKDLCVSHHLCRPSKSCQLVAALWRFAFTLYYTVLEVLDKFHFHRLKTYFQNFFFSLGQTLPSWKVLMKFLPILKLDISAWKKVRFSYYSGHNHSKERTSGELPAPLIKIAPFWKKLPG